MTEEGNSLAVAKELQAGAMMVSVEKNTDAKDTIEGSTTAEGPQELPAGALLSRFRHLSVSPRPRDSTPPAHRNSNSNSPGGGTGVTTTPDSSSTQQHLSISPRGISPRSLAGIPTAVERNVTTPEAGSPSTSQVSVGSIPPSLASALLPGGIGGTLTRHYDLTPVTRNTSELLARGQYVDEGTGGSNIDNIIDGYGNIVSPNEEHDQGILHGEHLAFPADPSASGDATAGGFTGPSIPKLRSGQRAQSLGSLDNHHHHTVLKVAAAVAQPKLGELQEEIAIPEPVEFPSRKFYSFTNREQYELAMGHHNEDDDASTEGFIGLEPYQPSREGDLGGVGTIPVEELRGIFIARRRGTDGSSGGESHANHRLLNPIPMDERQWSIPSIHLAHQLQGSIASQSYTENTEEDDESLLFVGRDDDASLSSRCSSLYLPDDTAGEPLGTALPMGPHTRSPFPRHIMQPLVVQMNPQAFREHAAQMDAQIDQTQDNDVDAGVSFQAVDGGLAVARRKRKQRKREERAFEWLQSVQGNDQVLAEAASSKFLTGSRRPAANAAAAVFPAAASASASNITAGAAYRVLEPHVPVEDFRKIATPAMMLRGHPSSPDMSENAASS
jgi:hypothetical protein